jgi:hypothetical protein
MPPADESTEPAGTDAESTALPAPEPQKGGERLGISANPATCDDAKPHFGPAACGLASSVEAAGRVTGKSGLAEPRVRGHRLPVSNESESKKKAGSDQVADDDRSQVTMVANVVAAPLQLSPAAVPNRRENSSNEVVLFHHRETTREDILAGISNAVEAPAAKADSAEQADPRIPGAQDFGLSRAQPMPAVLEAKSSSRLNIATREPSHANSSVFDSTAIAVGSFGAGDAGFNSENAVSSMRLYSAPGTSDRVQTTDRTGIENGVTSANLVEAISRDAGRSVEPTTESQVQLSPDLTATVASPKGPAHSTSRINLAASSTQRLKQTTANPADTFMQHAVDIQGNPGTSNAGIALPKNGIGISGSSKLEGTFTALDSGTGIDAAESSLSRSGRLQAEAGYQDPALGWIGVRAESSRGLVHATVIPQTADAAQAMGGHMAGLHAYLADNRTPVETLTLTSFCGNDQHLPGSDSGRGMHQGTDHRTGQEESDSLLNQDARTRVFGGGARDASVANEVVASGDASRGLGGRHISVVV